ncbi:hypothetical protein AMAG_13898 [Allomyces macrogynus ATCC 38327]|uniref:Cytochrome P450 n=1 Tax=Allomyces macrogynus (strain ATCC 38327) TaxID=578462 RepID=A0A0L0T2U9_ALLM3|nr:hypothetical protein AMAG_13898 [Allomyces macrogynus ATCC 38327]|eukprot:KNE69022.1 hypothetical protein AMAG_13898 [Allomyces macrogynus ATCC 38327]
MHVVDDANKGMLHNAVKDPYSSTLIHELLRQNAGIVLSEHELICELHTLLAAGHENASSAPHELLQELLDELAMVTDLTDYNALSKLPRLNGVINVTLRVFPLAYEMAREVGPGGVTVPTTAFGLLDLPEGLHIEIPIRGIHCGQPIWGDDAMTWNPYRWDHINLFALMELRFVACIVKRYALTTDVPMDGVQMQSTIRMRMTNAWVRFERPHQK